MEKLQEAHRVPVDLQKSRTVPRWDGRFVKNLLATYGSGLISGFVALLILLIAAILLRDAWSIFSTQSLAGLIFTKEWHPSRGVFGLWVFILGSFYVTLIALCLSVPIALLSSLYLSDYMSSSLRSAAKPVIDILAGIPSVVFGLWGVLFVVPVIREDVMPWCSENLGEISPLFQSDNPSGYSLLAGGVVLAIMTLPILISVMDEVLQSVPQGMREASLSLGATEWETTRRVVLKKAAPGIFAAIILGFSRAFGETLAVIMVIGNVPRPPHSVFDPAYTLPGLIANNYGEMASIPYYKSALMSAALILLVVTFVFNLAARLVLIRIRRGESTL